VSEWPEPSPEPGEQPRWLGWGVLAILVGALLWTTRDGDWTRSFADVRLPELSLPQIEMPEIDWPDFGSNDNSVQLPDGAITQESIEAIPGIPPVASSDFGAPIVQNVPFETCLETTEGAIEAIGSPIMLEDSPDRRVVRFKLLDGDITMTCARAEGTISIARREG
jgi:hypothetical protein